MTKKITKAQINEAVRRELEKVSRKSKLKEAVRKAVRKALLSEKVDPNEFPLKLSDVAADPEDAKADGTKGTKDGDPKDDVNDVKPVPPDVVAKVADSPAAVPVVFWLNVGHV